MPACHTMASLPRQRRTRCDPALTLRPLLWLAAAALLEAGGDALVRAGLGRQSAVPRVAWMSAGALVLFAYGITVVAGGMLIVLRQR